ncbi:hypothetical protein [Rickettsia asembonensis]|uniref:Uncharacterized protein n=1 Tax=Rickettsia asembonensis TaxID=1068590 RepID=A0A0C2QXS4_9RICK|nr:hypothetical protein [Rickettsia asembonensis]KIJ88644.1 hypothetical protein SB78_04490 [Rickettsia asembonensis]WCR56751.1 MAG: hypothetical protein PG979_000808 [Rickettsia asembonensis]
MTKQDTIYNEELCNAENILNYFKYLHKNNKLGICKPYLLDITGSSNLQNILTLARNDKECALINSMNQLVSGLEEYISHKDLERIMQSCYSKEHERYSLLGDSPEK